MRICLDAGHGGADPGAQGHGFKEKDLTLGLVLHAASTLRLTGHRVSVTRDSDATVTLARRVEICKAAQAELFVSVHLNADADPDLLGMPEARGTEILYYSENGLRFARLLQFHFEHEHKLPFRGLVHRPGLYVLKKTPCPAVIVELGFVDSQTDLKILQHPEIQAWLGDLLAKAVSAFSSSAPSS